MKRRSFLKMLGLAPVIPKMLDTDIVAHRPEAPVVDEEPAQPVYRFESYDLVASGGFCAPAEVRYELEVRDE